MDANSSMELIELQEELHATQQLLQHEKEENEYLRSLLRQLETGGMAVGLTRAPQDDGHDDDDDDDDSDRAKARTATLELKHAEDKIRQLEMALLDTEETVCHLKAERLEALREVERLSLVQATPSGGSSSSSSSSGQSTEELHAELNAYRNQVYALEHQLADVHKQHAVDQEQCAAVIREQEQEVRHWKDEWKKCREANRTLQEAHDGLREQLQQALQQQDRGDNQRDHDEPEVADWREELIRHPTPSFDLDSPEVQYLLHSWTSNVKKLQYLRVWLAHIAHDTGDLPTDFPLGLELPRLAPEICDGFLTLVVPLLRKQTKREIYVHTRRHQDDYHADLRLRIVNRSE
ncbi:TPA: hypothetical protein N0F65_011030 [Lagenidium giganteum]|uniref:Uncharacterized protein n=1 Tax=Lagenidium giganteum TaxID=4803 RepID=A0AAV2Z6G3_9STRA|nr:TPA: hypothetical protein N0F65_011030 [Lagenidium giganteum]